MKPAATFTEAAERPLRRISIPPRGYLTIVDPQAREVNIAVAVLATSTVEKFRVDTGINLKTRAEGGS